jgi:hypothetical protein
MKKILDALKVIGTIILVFGCWYYLSKLKGCSDEDNPDAGNVSDTDVNPLTKQGIDSILYNDSMYIITTKIDCVYKWNPKYNKPYKKTK